mmetsp:Transcript_5291/g.12008  ORF Transcript_5291/g.12008 Transcript_5291/m.12008 type:complete len:152 (+) Transcript_5291:181-636(+)|eukprot:CAMPEP_0172315080 /NCGR_PEP_ID=MMETSP1058-20130122/24049_1 /TAXON_ID=83371 /ORGANISM="Detonula confervacea, Strain CCMP 353" /LENGTH=151 /DNA_ID=CAMNT_0013029077 /DNA_START=102 /DNA_END=557 /DNA_ORIENTATION=-
MSYCKASAIVEATPETIWDTCFAPMRWELWDHNIKKLTDVSGGCDDGTTCIFEQKDGKNFSFTLSNVEKNKRVDFSGVALGGTIKAEGKVLITPVDNFSTKIDYSFELSGSVGFVVAILKKRAVVEGTEGGLANMVKMSEEAQGSEIMFMN